VLKALPTVVLDTNAHTDGYQHSIISLGPEQVLRAASSEQLPTQVFGRDMDIFLSKRYLRLLVARGSDQSDLYVSLTNWTRRSGHGVLELSAGSPTAAVPESWPATNLLST
jgi:hypothetical protein